jgi:hypothetical protein
VPSDRLDFGLGGAILARDTTEHGRRPVLRVTPAAWRRLTAAVGAD